MPSEKIKEQLKRLPRKPGVYQFFNEEGVVIYVGKAKSLKSRVSSYFTRSRHDSGKTRILASKVRSIEVIVVETEPDALFLENSLIKKFQPRYNILLKDDKSFPSIVIKNERFPRIFPTRKLIKDGSDYYGPYANVKTLNAVLDLIKKLYPIRTCNFALTKENVEKGKFKICLEYHLGNCLGPCEDRMSEADYNENVDAIRAILKGNLDDLVKSMKQVMQVQAEALEFEIAAKTKKKVDLLERFQARSTIVNPKIQNVDVFTIVSDANAAYVNYMKIHKGVVVHGHSHEIKKKLDESDAEILAYVIPEIRARRNSQSKEVFVNLNPRIELDGASIHIPQRGDKKRLIQLSEKNAQFFMRDRHKQIEQVDPDAHVNRILSTMKDDLHLQELPVHIECFDNSNIQGTNPASACVVFKNAKPSKADYRKFTIKTVDGPDDFASMTEAVSRRYRRLRDEGESFPQLVIIDGGKGQLSAAVKALEDLGLRGQIPIIGIAKRLEEIYFPGDSIPIYLDKRSESLKLIQHLRNEAHRFSLAHHRSKRSKQALASVLTDIAGVGGKTAEDLLRHFKSVKRIKEARLAELETVVNRKAALAVYQHFNQD